MQRILCVFTYFYENVLKKGILIFCAFIISKKGRYLVLYFLGRQKNKHKKSVNFLELTLFEKNICFKNSGGIYFY